MARVALIVHRERPAAIEGARRAVAWLDARGHEVWMSAEDAGAVGLAVPAGGNGTAEDAELAVALGGDGTILRAVGLVARYGVPLLGVNLGRLGFLTDVEPGALDEALDKVMAGDYMIEERMVMAVTVVRAGGGSGTQAGDSFWALNEAVVERPAPGHTLRVAVTIGSKPWTTYAADGLIVSTPTGSTAYAFSAGGPILSPRLRALQLTPVAPHMPFGRSLVVDASEPIRVELAASQAAVLVVDGRSLTRLGEGDAVVCSAAAHAARFVTFEERDFYGILKAKFHVADR